MILNNAVNAGGFIYCMAYFGPNESSTYFNDGHGHYHQYVYIIDGRGSMTVTDVQGNILSVDDSDRSGQLFDASAFKGMYHITKTTNSGLTMIMFNPIPDTRSLSVDIIKGSTTKTVTATDSRITVVGITGLITINNKELLSLQHAKIFPGKTAELILPENTVCALVSG
jgi:hypothetical protein